MRLMISSMGSSSITKSRTSTAAKIWRIKSLDETRPRSKRRRQVISSRRSRCSEARALVAVAEDEFDLLGAQELFFEAGKRAIVEDRAAVDDHDTAAEFFDVVEIVGREKDRGVITLVDGAEELANVIFGDDVEADGGLVEK